MRVAAIAGLLLVLGVTCLPLLSQAPPTAAGEQLVAEFERALSIGQLTGAGGAYEKLQEMRAFITRDDWSDKRDGLLDVLTRRASQVVNRYTKGDEVPQKKADYDQCAALYEAANQLDPSAGSEARMWFCRGRSYLEPGEQRDLVKAVECLKQAIQADPENGGYHYNALGVAYLQQGLTKEAAEQFQKAIDHDSPTWTYPRHHLALTYLETGDYSAAQEQYREAIAKAGDQQTGYLHYNLGLLAHQLGQRKEAQREYQTALKLFMIQMEGEQARHAPDRAIVFKNDAAEACNALGALWAAEGKHKQAAEYYQQSLKLNPDLEAARTNLDLLRGRGTKPAKR
jgi:tetratricopeptide (TPR) repeat protein